MSVQIDRDTATEIVCCGCHGDVIFGNINAETEAFLIDIGEVLFCLFRVFVGDVEINMVITPIFHFVVDGTGYDIARSE